MKTKYPDLSTGYFGCLMGVDQIAKIEARIEILARAGNVLKCVGAISEFERISRRCGAFLRPAIEGAL